MYSVIMIRRTVFAVYLVIMLFKICHLSFISHSSISISISSNQLEGHNTLQKYSKSFNHTSFSNFSLFSIINQRGKSSLYVVCKNDTIIHIAMESMEMINMYRTSGCPYTLKYECEESVTINFLSEISLLNHNMIWFCYILPYNNFPSPAITNCIVPKNNILPDDLKWTKSGFSSTSNFYRTFAIQTPPHIFMGSYVKNSLLILRTNLPNVLGKIDSSQDLTTPMTEFYFEKNSHFLEVFKTEYEVYFVISEPIKAKSHGIPECVSSSDTRNIMSTRIIRICKDDPGGVPQNNENNFGTTAKAEIICPVGSGIFQYHYTHSISASWSGDKLYLLFESQKNSPEGKVLCIYDIFAFNIAFNSDMKPPIIFEDLEKRIANPIVDICKRLTEKSLNEKDKLEASEMSSNGLYRSKPIMPIGEAPIMTLRNLKYKSITTFQLSKFDPSTIIVFISDNSIRMVSHINDFKICFIQDFHLHKDEKINQVKGNNIKRKVFLHISTNIRVIQLELKMCQEYLTLTLCLADAPSICGWDSRTSMCTLLMEDTNLNQWQRSDCKDINVDEVWSLPKNCNLTNGKEIHDCICSYCILEEGCLDGKRINVTNCSDIFDEWSPWNECTGTSQYQNRTRKCKSKNCKGLSTDFRKCEYTSEDTVSSWTRWYKSNNSKYIISFRAKCSLNGFLRPIIESREMICDASCIDKTLKWTTWSDCAEVNIQYRLLNCSSIDRCPYYRTEIKQCPQIPRKYQQQTGEKETGYSMIHIVLAVLVASLIWLIICIVGIIFIFRYKFVTKHKSGKRERRPKFTSSIRSQQLFDPQRSMLSETSNDYLSRDLQLSSYNHDITDVSFVSTIESNRNHPYSRNIYTRLPLISNNHQNIRHN